MKLLLNDKEIANFLLEVRGIKISDLNDTEMQEDYINIAKGFIGAVIAKQLRNRRKKFKIDDKKRKKFKDKILRGVTKDLNVWQKKINKQIEHVREQKKQLIYKNIQYFIDKFGEQNILNHYKNAPNKNFVKGTGLYIDNNAQLVRRKNYSDTQENCLLRNTTGNEKIIVDKLDKSLPFWFIDSGYTNFIENNKKWHRLVCNHIHFGGEFLPPVDRLDSFKVFPKKWRNSGDRILIIEPGPFAASILHFDIASWKRNVEEELRQYTDKKIIFREKTPKKQRAPLYKHLCDEDYYCVISINSNAATEAVWAGIPIITLDKHITNSISRNKLSDINNLVRPHLANWLTMLSYSQFTYDELINGVAVDIIRKYHV